MKDIVAFIGLFKFRIIGVAVLLGFLYTIKRFKLISPIDFSLVKARISSEFGATNGRTQPHNGIDIAVPIGTKVIAPEAGEVTKVWNDSVYGGGLSIFIKHKNGYTTGYAHLNKQLVKVGQQVKKREVIAETGNTGKSTGPHLHFVIRKDGKSIDPATLINSLA